MGLPMHRILDSAHSWDTKIFLLACAVDALKGRSETSTIDGSYKIEQVMETDCNFPCHLLFARSTSPNIPCFCHIAIVVLRIHFSSMYAGS